MAKFFSSANGAGHAHSHRRIIFLSFFLSLSSFLNLNDISFHLVLPAYSALSIRSIFIYFSEIEDVVVVDIYVLLLLHLFVADNEAFKMKEKRIRNDAHNTDANTAWRNAEAENNEIGMIAIHYTWTDLDCVALIFQNERRSRNARFGISLTFGRTETKEKKSKKIKKNNHYYTTLAIDFW